MNKAELKKSYKEAKRPMGVYRITSRASAGVYVGFAIDLPAKINRHMAELRFGSHRNRDLQDAWNALGESAFDFEVLDVLDHEEDRPADPSEELRVLLEMWVRRLEDEGRSVATL